MAKKGGKGLNKKKSSKGKKSEKKAGGGICGCLNKKKAAKASQNEPKKAVTPAISTPNATSKPSLSNTSNVSKQQKPQKPTPKSSNTKSGGESGESRVAAAVPPKRPEVVQNNAATLAKAPMKTARETAPNEAPKKQPQVQQVEQKKADDKAIVKGASPAVPLKPVSDDVKIKPKALNEHDGVFQDLKIRYSEKDGKGIRAFSYTVAYPLDQAPPAPPTALGELVPAKSSTPNVCKCACKPKAQKQKLHVSAATSNNDNEDSDLRSSSSTTTFSMTVHSDATIAKRPKNAKAAEKKGKQRSSAKRRDQSREDKRKIIDAANALRQAQFNIRNLLVLSGKRLLPELDGLDCKTGSLMGDIDQLVDRLQTLSGTSSGLSSSASS